MRRKYPIICRIVCVVWLFALVMTLAACQSAYATGNFGTEDTTEPLTYTGIKQDFPWSMQAVLVNDQGEVIEERTLEVEGYYFTDESDRERFHIEFWYTEDVQYDVEPFVPGEDDPFSYVLGTGMALRFRGDKTPECFYTGIDLENGCFIIDFNDEQDVYLMAYLAPDTDISLLWEHFQGFFELEPDEFPVIIQG